MSATRHAEDTNPESKWVQKTNLFRRWEQVREEIDRHKWYESEKAGHDIGWERAAVDWFLHHGVHDAQERSHSA